jgi:eukaryotic translation initiation factor 2C
LTLVYRNGTFPQPDATTTKVENSANSLATAFAALRIGDYTLPKRPGYGKMGTPVVLWTNYLELTCLKSDVDFFRYSVAISEKGDKLKARKTKRLIQQLLALTPFTEVACASDWAQNVITSKKLDLIGDQQDFDIEWYPEDGEPLPTYTANESEDLAGRRESRKYTLRVKYTDSVSVGELAKDLASSTVTYPSKVC